MIKVTVVIPTYNRKVKLLRLVASIYKSTLNISENKLEIIVVDNGSTDGAQAALRHTYTNVILVQNKENAYSGGGRNSGAAIAKGEYVFFVDDDNILDPDCIQKLIDHLDAYPSTGLAAPLMLDYNEKNIIWCDGAVIKRSGLTQHINKGLDYTTLDLPDFSRRTDYFPNAYITRKSILKSVQHDLLLFPHNWAEQDFSIRIQAQGFELAVVNKAITEHDFGIARKVTRIGLDKTFDQARSRLVFRRKYMNHAYTWLLFWGYVFPISTVYYFKIFFIENRADFKALVFSYVKGTYTGLTQKIT